MENLLSVGRLIVGCEEIQGRKKLQKIVHILQCKGYPFRQRFGYLHFGPYSAELRAEVEQLSALGLIEEVEGATETGYAQFDCRPKPGLEEQLIAAGYSDEPAWLPLARELNGLETRLLEAISTILFLRQRGYTGEDLKLRFSSLKPVLCDLYDDALRRSETFIPHEETRIGT